MTIIVIVGGSLQTYTKDDVEEVRCADDDGYLNDGYSQLENPAGSTNSRRFSREISDNSKF